MKALLAVAALCLTLITSRADAEPIKLKLSFFSSDRAMLYRGGVKPFVDVVNAEGKGIVEIDVYFSGALGRDPALQAQMALDGTADIAYITPGYTAERFPDTAVIELPGLFKDQREASLVYTRLVAANALKGYEGYFVINAFTMEPHSIHTRPATATLDDLKGLRIRANNPTEAKTFERLGMQGVVMPINQVPEAIGLDKLDGAAIPPVMLFEFGINRVTTYHYMLRASAPPLALVMNRKTFENLPPRAQEFIRKYSGEWAAIRSYEIFADANRDSLKSLQEDSRRKVIELSANDRQRAELAFKSVIDDWAAASAGNAALLQAAKAEIARLRNTAETVGAKQ